MPTPRRWFITGAHHGFGRHLTEAALDRGDRVVAAVPRPEDRGALVDLAPGRVWATHCDLVRGEEVRRVVEAAVSVMGGLDVVVHTLEVDPAPLARAVLPTFRAQGGGRLLHRASAAGHDALVKILGPAGVTVDRVDLGPGVDPLQAAGAVLAGLDAPAEAEDPPPAAPVRRPVVSVVGQSDPDPALAAAAEEIGRRLVDAGLRVATGGKGGVMAAVSRGARSAAGWREGDVLGILPGLDPAEANRWVDVVVPTGLNHARNVVLVAMADVVVAVGGGAGTLSEIALAWQHGKPIVALAQGEGWAAILAGQAVDGRRRDVVHAATSAAEVVAEVNRLLGTRG